MIVDDALARVVSVNYGYKRAKSHNFAVKPSEIAVRRAVEGAAVVFRE